jgi:hypothetical protein
MLLSSTTAGLASKGQRMIGVDSDKSRGSGTNQEKPQFMRLMGAILKIL